MKAVSAKTMQELDRRTIEEFGIPGVDLMEQAGENCANAIIARFTPGNAVILAGKGNNGGDGFVIARLLADRGWQVELMLFAEPDELAGDAMTNFKRIPAAVKLDVKPDTERLQSRLSTADVIIDALLGTGLQKAVSGELADAVAAANSSGRPVVAVDIPSGVDATSGKLLGTAVKADLTVTFGAAKLGQILYPGAEQCGELLVTDIGIPEQLLQAADGLTFVDELHAAGLLRTRNRTAHKGSFGHLLVVAGSTGKSGAAAMTANSAVRGGAGLVTVAAPESINKILEIKTTEAMTFPVKGSPAGGFSSESTEEILTLCSGKSVMALGPGVGQEPETIKLVQSLVARSPIPILLDADGLNAIACHPASISTSQAPFIIMTPHPGEMARLCGKTVAEIESDRLETARSFAAGQKIYLLLKGARTVIAAPDGRIAVNSNGNPGMATGGSGDVLAGLLAALVSQGYEPFDACCLGAFIHGLAGDMVAEQKGEIGMNATDIQEMLPFAFRKIILSGSYNI